MSHTQFFLRILPISLKLPVFEQHTCYFCPWNRDDFSVKLALLSNQWQCVVRRAQQRRGIIDSLVRQWQNYQEMAEKLLRWLHEVSQDPDVHQPGEPVALQQARNLLDQIQVGYRTVEELHIILKTSSDVQESG